MIECDIDKIVYFESVYFESVMLYTRKTPEKDKGANQRVPV